MDIRVLSLCLSLTVGQLAYKFAKPLGVGHKQLNKATAKERHQNRQQNMRNYRLVSAQFADLHTTAIGLPFYSSALSGPLCLSRHGCLSVCLSVSDFRHPGAKRNLRAATMR